MHKIARFICAMSLKTRPSSRKRDITIGYTSLNSTRLTPMRVLLRWNIIPKKARRRSILMLLQGYEISIPTHLIPAPIFPLSLPMIVRWLSRCITSEVKRFSGSRAGLIQREFITFILTARRKPAESYPQECIS